MSDTSLFTYTNPFAIWLGIKLISCNDEGTHTELELRDELLNSFHIAHGGVSMSLLDITMAQAARFSDPRAKALSQPRSTVVTVDMKTSFLRPAKPGKLHIYGQVLRATDSLVFTEGWIIDRSEKKVVHATGTFKYLRASTSMGHLAATE